MKNHLFAATVARQLEDGTWLLMNKQENGFNSFAYPFFTLEDIEEHWHVKIGRAGEDEFSTYRHVLPLPRLSEQAARALGKIPDFFEAWYDEDDGSWVFHYHGENSVCVYPSGRVVLLQTDPAVVQSS